MWGRSWAASLCDLIDHSEIVIHFSRAEIQGGGAFAVNLRLRSKRQKQELAGSNGAVPASKRESGDPVVGLAVRIVEIIAIHIHCTRFRSWGLRRTCDRTLWKSALAG